MFGSSEGTWNWAYLEPSILVLEGRPRALYMLGQLCVTTLLHSYSLDFWNTICIAQVASHLSSSCPYFQNTDIRDVYQYIETFPFKIVYVVYKTEFCNFNLNRNSFFLYLLGTYLVSIILDTRNQRYFILDFGIFEVSWGWDISLNMKFSVSEHFGFQALEFWNRDVYIVSIHRHIHHQYTYPLYT